MGAPHTRPPRTWVRERPRALRESAAVPAPSAAPPRTASAPAGVPASRAMGRAESDQSGRGMPEAVKVMQSSSGFTGWAEVPRCPPIVNIFSRVSGPLDRTERYAPGGDRARLQPHAVPSALVPAALEARPRRDGETGRRDGLKIRWPKGRGSSILPPGTRIARGDVPPPSCCRRQRADLKTPLPSPAIVGAVAGEGALAAVPLGAVGAERAGDERDRAPRPGHPHGRCSTQRDY
jgi:hypothetical protein